MSNILPKRPAATQKAKTGKKQRKWGRNARSCLAYRNSDRRTKNKVLRWQRAIKREERKPYVAQNILLVSRLQSMIAAA